METKSAAVLAAEAAGHKVYKELQPGRGWLLVSVCQYRGREYVHVRTWYFAEAESLDPEDPGNWKPGKGAAIPIELAGDVLDGLQAVVGDGEVSE
ncbi:MAG: transcriptional coactivator p15/PC4 family protein [Candidatus Bipolaricaulia bacterium]